MNRRQAVKLGGAALLAAVGGAASACNQKVITWAGIVVAAFEGVLPIFQDLVPNSVGIITKALAVALDLQAALKSGSVNSVDLIQQLIAPAGLFNQILDDVALITDVGQRRIVAGLLAGAGVFLRLIAAGLQQSAPHLPAGVLDKARGKSGVSTSTIEKVAKSDDLERLLQAAKF